MTTPDNTALLALATRVERKAIMVAQLVDELRSGAGTTISNAAFCADLFAIAASLRAATGAR